MWELTIKNQNPREGCAIEMSLEDATSIIELIAKYSKTNLEYNLRQVSLGRELELMRIDPDKMRKKIKAVGAESISPYSTLMRPEDMP